LAEQGAAVAVVGRSLASLEATARRIIDKGGIALPACGDITNPRDILRIFEEVTQQLGSPSILVNAVAVPGPFGPIGVVSPDDWWDAISVHLKAPMLLLNEALPAMFRAKRGRVIVVSSFLGGVVYPHLSAYSIGKGAQSALVAHAAEEHKGSGLAFFAIQPGVAHTKMTEDTLNSPEFEQWAPQSKQRMQRFLETNDDEDALAKCAQRCVQLASGKYDRLSGRFLMPLEDLDELLSKSL
jgi:NAD(P)-dependent dehydrogenase (short-subunit alcohol dehydrogenase family)